MLRRAKIEVALQVFRKYKAAWIAYLQKELLLPLFNKNDLKAITGGSSECKEIIDVRANLKVMNDAITVIINKININMEKL